MKNAIIAFVVVLSLILVACAQEIPQGSPQPAAVIDAGETQETARATFAGGCFWCVEYAFDGVPGVIEATSGYTAGDFPNPTYKQVSSGGTGHIEAVQVEYVPETISYEELLYIFWRTIDPRDGGGQFADRGFQYTTAIFYHDEEQKSLAEQSKQELADSGKFDQPIVTPIQPAEAFFEAEEYHQDYSEKNPIRYKTYSTLSGRVGFLERTWGSE